jgi:hypothetical protein
MEQHAQEQEDLRLYLLGLLSPERQTPVEKRLLTDATLYEELLIAEDELIDEYLDGDLPEREREGFVMHFMKARERQQQLRFAGALKSYVAHKGASTSGASTEQSEELDQEAEPGRQRMGILSSLSLRKPAVAFSLAAAALLLVCGVSWMAFRSLRPRGPHQVLIVLLTPGGQTRSGGNEQQVIIPVGTDALRLKLRLSTAEFQSYRATLLNAEGATVLMAERLQPESADGEQIVVVSVPAQPGEYQLKLDGFYADGRSESADSYRFRVVGR